MLSDESEIEEEEALEEEKFLAFVAPYEDKDDSQSYYSIIVKKKICS
jgi:hypothetical protein